MIDLQKKRILIVDDNEDIHHDFRKILENGESNEDFENEKSLLFPDGKVEAIYPSYQIDDAYQGDEAVTLIKNAVMEKNPYALAFVDIRMPPGSDGVKTIQNIWKVDTNIQIVICTAFSDYSFKDLFEELKRSDNFLILKKPFDPIEILQLASALTKKWELNYLLLDQLDFLDSKIQEHVKAFRN